jgi:hypothetical protein
MGTYCELSRGRGERVQHVCGDGHLHVRRNDVDVILLDAHALGRLHDGRVSRVPEEGREGRYRAADEMLYQHEGESGRNGSALSTVQDALRTAGRRADADDRRAALYRRAPGPRRGRASWRGAGSRGLLTTCGVWLVAWGRRFTIMVSRVRDSRGCETRSTLSEGQPPILGAGRSPPLTARDRSRRCSGMEHRCGRDAPRQRAGESAHWHRCPAGRLPGVP